MTALSSLTDTPRTAVKGHSTSLTILLHLRTRRGVAQAASCTHVQEYYVLKKKIVCSGPTSVNGRIRVPLDTPAAMVFLHFQDKEHTAAFTFAACECKNGFQGSFRVAADGTVSRS